MWRLTPVDPQAFAKAMPDQDRDRHPSANGLTQFLTLLANSPAGLRAYLQAEQALGHGQLTPAQRENISLLVAEINGSNYCLAAHELAAKRVGLSDQDIWSARKALGRDPQTKAMLNFVQAIVLQRGEIRDDDFSTLRTAGFADGQIIEILANTVLNIFTNYFNLLAQTEHDQPLSRPDWPGGRADRTVTENRLPTPTP
jgi:uncharacterized peroxidase-related enzyme